ncbi:hypothetical protein [Streptomyces sp. NPDC002952]|uniref:hypothetical protein n=1 Tax=Streptomyces sp. NPDC002952 TaxID=3364673 RepID=UPI0036A7A52D
MPRKKGRDEVAAASEDVLEVERLREWSAWGKVGSRGAAFRLLSARCTPRAPNESLHGLCRADLRRYLVQYGGHRVRALCVITWNEDEIRPWVTAMGPAVLGDGSAWEELTPELDPVAVAVAVEALKGLTLTVNHNNTIAAGYEKDMVVSALLALHDAGIPMDGEAVQGWALAHGWSGKNPGHLAKYVEDINAGKRPRCRRVLGTDYIDTLRRRAADNA